MKTCLIVDDSAVIRKVAKRIIEAMNFTVTDVEDAEQGLALCAREMPDLIIVDGFMPGMDGYDFTRELRRMPDGGLPSVLISTLENDVATVARVFHVGGNTYLPKPFDTALIRAKMEEVGVLQAPEAPDAANAA